MLHSLLFILPRVADGQTRRGTAIEAETGAAVTGALVQLVGADGGIAASRVMEAGRTDDALAFAKLNVESHADVSLVHAQLGQILMRKGDRAGAIESFQRALKLDATNAAAQRGLKAAEEAEKPR